MTRPGFYHTLAGFLLYALLAANAACQGQQETLFTVSAPQKHVPLVVSREDATGVIRAVGDFQEDIHRVTGRKPELLFTVPHKGTAILVGTIGQSEIIDRLIDSGKLDAAGVSNRWEAFVHEVVENPFPGVDRALVIAGSDRRGTIFGVYTLSEEFGVSPWYWWADVPVTMRDTLEVSCHRRIEAPVVRYRGIFLNDEAPALSGWAAEKYGGINSGMYVHVFELLLRLRANFLWPAMWNNAFHDDDPMSPVLAHEYGIVMGTSHHEPMMRAHKEWALYGRNDWNYATNGEFLREFWRTAIQDRKVFESIITLAMRGDGDEAMSEETNVSLLEQIVADQRNILKEEIDRPLQEIPQVWALYKEVQDYYERGMRVPDDVTLLWCDDNWGNIRRLPTPDERKRPGGAGVYYHFDYVGGPRSYKWLNVQPLTKIWEQMHLAWKHDANRIWIVNVGDLKPMELPIDFFLTMAWNPAAMPYERIGEFTREWAAQAFGSEHSGAIAGLLDGYTKLNRQRTPEMLEPETYSLVNYREAERISASWEQLAQQAGQIRDEIGDAARDTYFQLVYYPVKASANIRQIHIATGLNHMYALQGRTDTNAMAARVEQCFQVDQDLAAQYHSLSGGKWNHMMDQVNLGYTYWQQPPIEVMPAIHRVRANAGAVPGLAIEGSTDGWPAWGLPVPKVPPIDRLANNSRWIELFNRGDIPFEYKLTTDAPWLVVDKSSGTVSGTTRIGIGVDWTMVPPGESAGNISIMAASENFSVVVPVVNPVTPDPATFTGYVESDRHLAMEAPRFSRSGHADGLSWMVLPGHGRALGGVTLLPVDAPPLQADPASGHYPAVLEYDFYCFSTGAAELVFHLAPSLDIQSGEGLRFAFSIDGDPVKILPVGTWNTHPDWQQAVASGVREVRASVEIVAPGKHTLKVWAVTPAVVFQRFILDFGGVRSSYLGPPESPYINRTEIPDTK